MTYAIITAAGKGTRAKLDVPKQFFEVYGRPLITYTLDVFEKCPLIDAIILVLDSEHIGIGNELINKYYYKKILYVVEGGETNQLSIYNALKTIKDIAQDDDIVVIHDGVRCLVTESIIESNLNVCKKMGNAITAVPSNEAMLYSVDGITSKSSIPREYIFKTQTPHSIYFKEAYDIFDTAFKTGKTNSVALCTLLVEGGKCVYFSNGSNLNFKITQPEDINLFIAHLNSKERIDFSKVTYEQE